MKKTVNPKPGAIMLRHFAMVAICTLTVASSFMPISDRAIAGPVGGSVVGGSAAISQSGNTTTINQGSTRAIINWRGFDINVNELVKFYQPGRDAIALNRVTGGNPTTILGQLAANGRIFIVNPNGVIFGASSKVDVAGLLATTFDIKNADFMSGKYNFVQSPNIDPSFIINNGEIRIADNGFCFLVAAGVKNEGVIVAQLGKVVMASGKELTIDFNGDGLLTYNVSGKVLDSIKGPDGKALSASVSNEGTISAPGGHVVLVGNAAREAFSSVVNNSGVIEARSLVVSGGTVTLLGGDEGIVQNTGSIDVSGVESGAKSGEVSISGQYAGNFGTILAKGETDSAGGRVVFDSSIHTLLGTESLIDVSGGSNSSAGAVLLRSDNHTTFNGLVLARGGETGRDGGFVDVSSKGQIDLWGHVDAMAPYGRAGTLLIDPKNIEVKDATGVAYNAGVNNLFSSNPAGDTIITASSINAAGANVVLQANNDITITDAINISGTGLSLTMQAGRSVLVNNDITTNNGGIAITANDSTADLTNRDAWAGNITVAAGKAISSGTASITLTIDGTGPTPGSITADTVATTGTVTLSSVGSILRSGTGVISGAEINLTVTDSAATIGTDVAPLKINGGTLTLTTAGGNAILEDTEGGVAVGPIDVGGGALLLSSTNGAINYGSGTIKAGSVILKTEGLNGGAIGTLGNPILTNTGILTAFTNHGGIYINEENGLLINSVIARESTNFGVEAGVAPTVDASNQLVLRGLSATQAGTFDVVINAGGDIVVDTVTAPDVATIRTSSGVIFDNNQLLNNVTARTVDLQASGAIGQSADPIEAIVETTKALTTDGDIYLSLGNMGRIESVVAGGTDRNVGVTGTSGTLRLGTVSAGGAVTVSNSSGSLVDDNGNSNNITALNLDLSARDGIGSATDPIDTTVSQISATVTGSGAVTYINNNALAVTSAAAKTNDGDVTITYTGGQLNFVSSTDQLSASGAALTLENTGGHLVLTTIDAGAGAANLTAQGSIKDDANDTTKLTAATATLRAGGAIGAAGNELDTAVGTLNATANAGGVYVREDDALTLTASASGAGKDIDVRTATGNLTLGSVAAPDQVVLVAGGSIAAAVPANTAISASGATLDAGAGIGPLNTSLATLSATAAGGGLSISNSRALNLSSAAATDDITVTASGNLTIGAVSAPGKTVTLTSNGEIIDGNGAATNVTANAANLSGSKIGASGAAIGTAVNELTLSASAGGIYVDNAATNLKLISATSVGSGADVVISNTGNIELGVATALGDSVVINSGGFITDGNGSTVNVTADSLTITAPLGIDPLQLAVNKLTADGGSGGATFTNANALAVTEATLEAAGTGPIILDAPSITILDILDDLALLSPNRSLTLRTQGASPADSRIGNIIFLDQNDTVQTQGSGSITIQAGVTPGSGAVAILGNLKTENQPIDVSADSHITIGLLDAGTANVNVVSRSGIILDGNGTAVNIIAGSATLSGNTPSARQAELRTIQAIADASATRSEAASTQASADAFSAGAAVTAAAQVVSEQVLIAAQNDVAAKQAAKDAADAAVEPVADAVLALTIVSQTLDVANTVAGTIAAVAQAVPFTGDGGSATAAFAITVAKNVTDIALLALNEELDRLQNVATDAAIALSTSTAQAYAAQSTLDLATSTARAFQESYSTMQKTADAAAVARDAAAKVQTQAINAEDIANVAGTPLLPLGIKVPGQIDVTAGESNVYLKTSGPAGLGDISATNTARDSKVLISKDAAIPGDVTVKGTITAQSLVRIDATGGAILNGGGRITAPEFVATALSGIGTSSSPLQTQVDRFAADGGTGGGVSINNNKALIITTVDGVNGITTNGGVSSITSNGTMTFESPINAFTGTVLLNATDGAIIDNNTSAFDIKANSLGIAAASSIAASGNPLETQVSNFEAQVTSGDIYISNTAAALNIGGVSTSLTGVNTGSVSTVDITTSGSLGVNTGGEVVSTAAGGAVNLVAAGTVSLGNGSVSTGTTGSTVIETSAGSIVGAAGTANIITGTLALKASAAGGSVRASGAPLPINAATMSVTTGSAGVAGGLINISDTAGGIIVTGATTNGGNVPITIIASSPLTISGDVLTGGAVTLVAGNNNAATNDDLTVAGGVKIESTGSTVDLTAGDKIVVNSGAQVKAAGLLKLTANNDADSIGAVTLSGTLDGAGVTITGTGLDHTSTITSSGAVNITVLTVGIHLGSIDASGQTVTLISGGAITDNNDNTPSNNVRAQDLVMQAMTGIGNGANGALETDVTTLQATNNTSGDINIHETSGLTVVGSGVRTLGGNGNINIDVDAGDLILSGVVTAHGAGNVTLKAHGGSITDTNPSATVIVGNTVTLDVAGGASTIGTSANILEIDAVTLNAATAGGSIYIEDTAGGVAVGLVTAGIGDVNLKATGGSLTEVGSDPDADIVGDTVNLEVTGIASTIGTSTETLEIDAVTLNATTEGGSIYLEDTAGGVAVGLVTAGIGDVNLKATGGSLTEAGTDADADIVGSTVNLEVSGLASTIGTSTETLEIDATTLNAATEGGSIYIEDTAGGVAVGLVTAGIGDVNLKATGGSLTEAGTDADADIVGSTVNLVVTGLASTIGTSTETLEIDATTLNAATEGGSIYIEDTAGGVAVGLVTAGIGDVNLKATGGSLTEAGTDADADIVGSTVNLVVTGLASTIGTSTETLEINATTLNATTEGGSIYIEDTAGGVAVGLVTAGIGDVNLKATGGSLTEAGTDADADIVGSTVNLEVSGLASTIGTSTETLEINATTLNATTEGGSIYIEDTAGGVAVGLVTAGIGDVNLKATGGSLTEAGTDADADIVGSTINLVVTGVNSTIGTSANTLEIDATTLNATTEGGSIYIEDTAGGVAVGLVTAGIGDVNLKATGGSLTEAGTDADADIVGDTINLEVTGVNSTIGTSTETLEINATALNAATEGGSIYIEDTAGGVAVGLVTAGIGDVNLKATGGSLTEAGTDADADIVGSTINLVVTGVNSTIGTSANTLEIDATTLNATTEGGNIYIEDTAGGVAVGLVTAGIGDVNLKATGGSLTEAGTDADADIVGSTVNLVVTGLASTIGTSTETLEINATTLNATTEGGNIYLEDTAGGVAVGLVTAGIGDVNLKATGGSLTEAGSDPDADIVGDTINLEVTGIASTIGTSANTLEIDAVTLNAATAGGNIYLEDTAGGVAVGLVTAGIGDVNLKATGGSLTEAGSDPDADIVGDTINLEVTGIASTIGTSANTLEIDAVTLNAATAGGNIYLEDTAGGVAVGLVTAGIGDVNLKATGGSLTEAGTDADADIVGSTVNLVVTGLASTIGTSTETLEINATTLNAATEGGSIYLEDTAGGVAVGLVTAGIGDVNLKATGGSLTEAGTDASADIVGSTINLVVTGVNSTIGTSANTLEIDATTLNATTEGGSIYIEDTAGGVAVGLVTAGIGDVNLKATGGSLTEAGTDADADIVGDTINLEVTGVNSTIGTSTETLEINATALNAATEGGSIYIEDTAGGVAVGLVTAGIGDVNLKATGGSLTEAGTDASADIVGSTVNLVVTGLASTIGTSTETLEINATTLNAATAGGNIYLEDTAGGVAVGLVTAGIGDVNLKATGGSLTEAGTDASADIVGSTINLEVTGIASTIGTSANTLEIDAITLNAATAGGNIYIEDTAGGVAVGLVTAGIGDVNLKATGGSLTEAGSDPDADIVGSTVNLVVTGLASTIGTSTETLEINATTLNAATEGGNIYIEDTAGGVAVGLVTAGSGDVNLKATGGSLTEAGTDASADIVGSTINLVVTGANSTIGLPGNILGVSATAVNVQTSGGGLYINTFEKGVLWISEIVVPDLVIRDNHILGGTEIDRVLQAQTVLNPYQLLYDIFFGRQVAPQSFPLYYGEDEIIQARSHVTRE